MLLTLRNWLTFLRIHTSNLSQVGAILGVLIAGVRDIPTLILFAVWGFFYHAWGFTDNNLCDYEHDLKDPAKQHFALIKGDISLYQAKIVNALLFLPTLFFGLYLSHPISEHPTAFAFLMLAIVSGLLYNRTCKKSLLAPIHITIAFTALPLFSYFTVASTFSMPMVLVGAYTILLMLFQIAFEGYLKDIESDPVNLLRRLGAYTYDMGKSLYLGEQIYFWLTMKTATVLIGYKIVVTVQSDLIAELTFYILSTFVFILLTLLAFYPDGTFDNKLVTKNAARMEIVTYFALIVALQGLLGWIIVAILMLYPILWFLGLNKLTWKTWLRPKV